MSFTIEVIRDVIMGKTDIDLASAKLGISKKEVQSKVAEYENQMWHNN